MKGSFICLEGFEGAGKTTQAEALKWTLEQEYGRTVELVREPGGDAFGEHLRQLLKHGKQEDGVTDLEIVPWAEVFAFCAARTNMLALKVAPLLTDGVDVISDRNFVSTMAYQGWGNDWSLPDLSALRQVCQKAIRPAPPARIIVLDISYDTAVRRLAGRGEASDRFESRPRKYLEAVIRGYHEEARYGGHPIVGTEQPEEAVAAAILQEVLPVINRTKG